MPSDDISWVSAALVGLALSLLLLAVANLNRLATNISRVDTRLDEIIRLLVQLNGRN